MEQAGVGEDDAPYSSHIIGAFGVKGVNDLGEQVCPDKKERALVKAQVESSGYSQKWRRAGKQLPQPNKNPTKRRLERENLVHTLLFLARRFVLRIAALG